MERVAHEVGVPITELRRRNFYKEGEPTHYGQLLEGFQGQRCWDDVYTSSDYEAREASVAQFNSGE